MRRPSTKRGDLSYEERRFRRIDRGFSVAGAGGPRRSPATARPINTGSANPLTLAVFGDAPYGASNADTAAFIATPAFIDCGQPRSGGRPGRSRRRHPFRQPEVHRRLRPVDRRHVERRSRTRSSTRPATTSGPTARRRKSFPEATSAAIRFRTWPRCARSSSRASATRSAAARSRCCRRRRSVPAPTPTTSRTSCGSSRRRCS